MARSIVSARLGSTSGRSRASAGGGCSAIGLGQFGQVLLREGSPSGQRLVPDDAERA